VRRCGMRDCTLWPFRMGTNPWTRICSLAQRSAHFAELARAPKNPPSTAEKNQAIPFPGVRDARKASTDFPSQADNPSAVTPMQCTR
jgi:hypothetical protein